MTRIKDWEIGHNDIRGLRAFTDGVHPTPAAHNDLTRWYHSHAYARGAIVRYRETWGVVRSSNWLSGTNIDWWVGQYNAQDGEQWFPQEGSLSTDISAPFADDYNGIPDEVWARAAYYRMVTE